MNHTTMPEITDANRRTAFERLALHGSKHPNFEAAMADATSRAVIEIMAKQKRKEEWLATQERTVVPVPRCKLGVDGHPLKWCTQMVPGPLVAIRQPDLLTTY